MCGIIGYIGKENKNLSVLLDSLKKLEYRGYDSAGIAYLKNNEIEIIRSKGKISNLEALVDKNEKSYMGIGHTRWATHGRPSKENAHPHKYNHITLVHNGIIENADALKQDFMKKGIVFNSETDTEVISVLLNYLYEEYKDMKKVLISAMEILKGSYALGIICDEDKKRLYAIKKESPLIIGLCNEENFIASDIPAIKEKASKYMILDDYEFAIIDAEKTLIFDKKGEVLEKEEHVFDNLNISNNNHEYEHFMLKEINEQPYVINNLYSYYMNNFDDLKNKLPNFSKYNHIDIVACGSAYHAGLVGKTYLEEYANICANVHLASEYRYGKLFPNDKNLVILVSQSGETADTLAALKIAKTNNMDTLAIVNVSHSTIARSSDYVFYTNAGEEIAVATTKAYSAQIVAFIILSHIMSNKKIEKEEYQKNLPIWQKQMKDLIDKDYTNIIDLLKEHNSNFFLGRLNDYALAMEGSLKLKEITYINSTSYAAGELKHGTISLVDKDFPIIAVITDKTIADKTFSNLKEVKARGAKVISVISEDLDSNFDFIDEKIIIPVVSDLIKPIMTIIPLQMISYKLAYALGRDIDKPRNLAKSVTVE